MKPSAEAPVLPTKRPSWIIFVRILSAIGLGLSAYLLWGSLTQDHLPGCGFESGCDVVLHSRWASWFGVPVSGFALLAYALVFGGSWFIQNSTEPLTRARVWHLFICAAVALAAGAVWFISLQLLVVRAICPFCMAAHATGLLTSALVLANARRIISSSPKPVAGLANHPVNLSTASAAKYALGGLAAALILVVGQFIQPVKTYNVQPIASNALSTTNLPATTKASNPSVTSTNSISPATPRPVSAKPHRILQLHGDVFSLDLHEVPVHGSPDAKNIIVHLFDYSCKHCRQLHPILTEASHGLSNQLGIVSLPVPLDANCNYMIQRLMPDHTNACAYARAGLAVWRAHPEKLEEFNDWIFAPERPPPPETVRAEAMRLVGTNAFEAALRDPWIDRQLLVGIRLYETNYVRYRKSQLPEMMIGTNIVNGVPPNVEVLYRYLASQFDLQLPNAAGQ